MIKPSQLSHVILKTYQIDVMRDWYVDFLGARVVINRPGISCFMTWDDEHHRFGFLQLNGDQPKDTEGQVGLMHVGLTVSNVRSLLQKYMQMREKGVLPAMCTNHGATFSIYYKDPDGNAMEFFVDRFSTAEEANEFMESDVFKANGLGLPFDPEELLTKMEAGATDEELMAYDPEAAIAVDFAQAVQNMRDTFGVN